LLVVVAVVTQVQHVLAVVEVDSEAVQHSL
jgi:hypothetical protein